MQKKIINRSKFAMLGVCIALANGSNLYADGFYTIIGPDGRPMIVPTKTVKKEAQTPKQTNFRQIEQQIQKDRVESTEVRKAPIDPPLSIKTPVLSTESVKNVNISSSNEALAKDKKERPVDIKINSHVEPTSPKKIESNTVDIKKPIDTNTVASLVNAVEPSTEQSAFTKIEGVEYVNSEYLEDQEFNIDGKKRFYIMPDGNGRLETVERKKGITRSVLDKFMNRTIKSNTPIVLAESYMRLSEQDLSLTFENERCFLKDYSKSIKTLTPQKEVGLWPRRPLKEKFEYELVKIDASIQYMQIDSYTASNEKPLYYWPLVVFLDEKGCAREGVSGFKNKATEATFLQHAAIQGVIKVPEKVQYMMITPLASAVDVSEHELSNQGQIKISAIQ